MAKQRGVGAALLLFSVGAGVNREGRPPTPKGHARPQKKPSAFGLKLWRMFLVCW